MATREDKARDAGRPKVLCVGMLRTGTGSLAAALSELGFKHVFHGLDSRTKPSHWTFFERAVTVTWPEVNAPGQRPPPQPFTRREWDELFGVYDAVTDLSCFWALQLANAYPDAKIILTERDFDAWFPSFDAEVLRPLFGPWVDLFLKGVGTIIGNRAGFAMQKTVSGFFGGARTLQELHLGVPDVFRRHSEAVKAHVVPTSCPRGSSCIGSAGMVGSRSAGSLTRRYPRGRSFRASTTAALTARTTRHSRPRAPPSLLQWPWRRPGQGGSTGGDISTIQVAYVSLLASPLSLSAQDNAYR